MSVRITPRLVLVFLCFGSGGVVSLETTVPHHNCGSPLMYLTRLDVIPCQKDVCVLTRGEIVSMIADFVPRINSSKLSIDVYQQDPKYPVFETILWNKQDVCGKWNVNCPAIADEVQQARFTIRLPKSLPAMKLRLKLIAFGDNDTQLLCESVPLEIR